MNPVDEMSMGTESQESTPLVVVPRDQEIRLTFRRKLCFAIGGATTALPQTVIGFFLSIFLLEVAEVQPLYVSVIVFAGRGWDAITDPLVGYLCSRTYSKRFGQLRPWLLFSLVPVAASYTALWVVPTQLSSQEGKFVYYLIVYCLYQTSLTAYHVPYTSLTMHLSTKRSERDSATAYRMATELASTLLASISQGAIISAMVNKPECDDGVEDKPWLEDERKAYLTGAIVIGAVAAVAGLITFIGVKEQAGVRIPKPLSMVKGLKFVMKHKPYQHLTMFFLFSWLASQVVASNFSLYVEYVIELRGKFQNFVIALLVCAVIAMPFWQLFSVKFGKKTTFVCGAAFLFPGLFALLYLTNDMIPWMYVLACVAGLSTAVTYLIPWSMLPDCIDDAEVEFGERREPLFYAFFVFFQKFAIGVALGLSTVALQVFGGYETGKCQQPESVNLTLRILLSAPPMILNLIAFWFLWKYPISTARAVATRKTLSERGAHVDS